MCMVICSQGFVCWAAEWICTKVSFSSRNHICIISMFHFLKGTYHTQKKCSSLVLLLSFCHPTVSCLKMEKNGAALQPPPCFLYHSSPDIHHSLLGIHTAWNPLAQMAFQIALNVLTATVVKRLLSLILELSQSLALYCKSPRKLLDNWKWFLKTIFNISEKWIHFWSTLVLLTSPQSYKTQVSHYVWHAIP